MRRRNIAGHLVSYIVTVAVIPTVPHVDDDCEIRNMVTAPWLTLH